MLYAELELVATLTGLKLGHEASQAGAKELGLRAGKNE
jgi:hypothetical protein